MLEVQRFLINNAITYQCHPHHRNGNLEKSQWIISIEEEVATFKVSHDKTWVQENVHWGLHFKNGSLHYCGLDKTKTRKLIVAKFVSDPPNVWHGYPADPSGRPQNSRSKEIPPAAIQNLWLSNKVIPARTLKRISKGEPCNTLN